MDQSATEIVSVSDDSDDLEEADHAVTTDPRASARTVFHSLSRSAPVKTLEDLTRLANQKIPVFFDHVVHVAQDSGEWNRVEAFLEFAMTTNYIQGISACVMA